MREKEFDIDKFYNAAYPDRTDRTSWGIYLVVLDGANFYLIMVAGMV